MTREGNQDVLLMNSESCSGLCACKWDHEDKDRAETAILASLQALRVFCWGQNWWEEWHLGAHGRPPPPRCPVCLLSKQALYAGVDRGGPQWHREGEGVFIISRTFQYLALPTCLDLYKAGMLWKYHQLGCWYLLIYSDICEVCRQSFLKLRLSDNSEVLLNHSPEEIYQLFTVGKSELALPSPNLNHQPKIWKEQEL